MNDNADNDPRLYAIPDIHGHAKGEHKAFTDERPIPLSARMLFLWFYHACRRGWPRFLMVTDHMNYLTFEDPAAINLVRRALKLAQAGDLYGAAETASVEVGQAQIVSDGLRRGMRYSIGAEVDNDPRSRPDAQNIVDAMKPDGMIRSVHFLTIDHPVHGPNWNWPFDNPEFSEVYQIVGTAKTWELYMATLLDAVERLPGNIVGHFYVPALFGHWPDDAVLDLYENQIIDACEARGMALEMNTRFLYRDHSDEEKQKYLAVHRRLLAKCKARNVGIAVGSDAHSPKDQGRAFNTVLGLLDECEINELVFPIAGRLARVALRVERKDEAPPARDATAPPAADDRKTLRKPRTSEAPARPKDSSFKRDDSAAANEDAGVRDEAAPAKAKPRPKRSKNRAAAPADEAVEAQDSDAPAAANARDSEAADATFRSADPAASQGGVEITISDPESLEVAFLVDAEPVVAAQISADPTIAERVIADRLIDEPIIDEPIIDNPIIDEPIIDNPIIDQPIDPDPVVEEPTDAESLVREPIVPELRIDEFLIGEPLENSPDAADSNQVDSEHADSEPDDSEPVDSEPVHFGPVDAESVHAEPADSGPADSEPVDSEPGRSEVRSELVDWELSHSEPVDAEQAGPEPVRREPIVAENVRVEMVTEIVTEAERNSPAIDSLSAGVAAAAEDEAGAGEPPIAADAQWTAEPVGASNAAVGRGRPKPASLKAKSSSTPAKKKTSAAKSKPATKKSAKPSAKAVTKKASVKKTGPKKIATKTAGAKKAPAKKLSAKKAAVREVTAKKSGAKKTAAKKTSTKKPAQKRR